MRVFMFFLILFVLSLSILITSCGIRHHSQRIPVTCSGPPSKEDYLITARGDLLINLKNVNSDFLQTEKILRKNLNQRYSHETVISVNHCYLTVLIYLHVLNI